MSVFITVICSLLMLAIIGQTKDKANGLILIATVMMLLYLFVGHYLPAA